MLLNRFARGGYLWHLPIDRDDVPRKKRPREVGHVNGGHTLIRLDGSADRESLEKRMSLIEGEASAAMAEIERDTGLKQLPRELSEPIAWLASLQQARSRDRLGYISHAVGDTSGSRDAGEGTPFDRQSSLLRVSTLHLFEAWSNRDNVFARPKDAWDPVAHALLDMRWDVMRYDSRCLAMSDAFAAQYGIRDGAPDGFERDPKMAQFGLNTPLWAARGLTIAITPQIALSLHHEERRKPVAAAAINMHTIRSARSFVAFPLDYSPQDVLPGWLDWIAEARFIREALPKAL
ncbi:hypothetical protein HMPREF1529_02356 [Microbacterium sp. oral taxon 186 str. F0373]|uniref:DUF4238 domain-containing protein n=2 Tax=Microbacteriaceae TaxID=85023 RepID=A0A2K9DBU9_9MICO|nr:DUF4238 domain-containing protein [Microbacterium hominis]EPD84291.1 hypothetical protein HMPREF1529_02356 [Microbacterium sp. oral taxon 186 str. F0373]